LRKPKSGRHVENNNNKNNVGDKKVHTLEIMNERMKETIFTRNVFSNGL